MNEYAISAALDQAGAAAGEAEAFMAALAAAPGNAALGWANTAAEPLLKIRAKLEHHFGSAPGLGRCEHLRGLEPVHWAAWAPGRLRCLPCLQGAAERIRGTVEETTCDACRQLAADIYPATVQLPPVVVNLGPEAPPVTGPPMLVHFGLCPTCYRAAVPGEAEPE